VSIKRPDQPSNWSLAHASSEYIRQVIQATLDIANEVMRQEGREATLDDVERVLSGRDMIHPPKHYPRLD